jgi:hypothetical protein
MLKNATMNKITNTEFSATSTTSNPHSFLYYSLKAIQNASNIVYFNGPRVKKLFDLDNSFPHLLSTEKLHLKKWSDLVRYINQTYSLLSHSYPTEIKTIHLHNELKFGDFLLLIITEYYHTYYHTNKLPSLESPLSPLKLSLFHEIMNQYQVPIVMTNTADENWGFLSTKITTRTTKWINMTNHLRLHYSNYDTVQWFLNSEKV